MITYADDISLQSVVGMFFAGYRLLSS